MKVTINGEERPVEYLYEITVEGSFGLEEHGLKIRADSPEEADKKIGKYIDAHPFVLGAELVGVESR